MRHRSSHPPTAAFRVLLVLGLFAVSIGIFALQRALWGDGRPPETAAEHLLSWASLVWLLPLVPALFNVLGFLGYRRPAEPPATLPRLGTLVAFRIVSRGQNAEALKATIANIRREMAELPLFTYIVEAVTDLPVDLGRGEDTAAIVVPDDYRTPNGSRYKARALEYALAASPTPDDAWIMHLDEESQITPSVILGIYRAVQEEEASGRHRIGQGAILYHRSLAQKPLLALADSLRTADDFGRFYWQQSRGVTLFGLHGSFILVRNSVAKEVGFDFGPEGSITEDAFWALKQMESGRRSRWVDGYVVEQAPDSAGDFIKQRRRWFVGLIKVVRHAPVRFRYRAVLAASVAIWSLSWIGIAYTYVNLLAGLSIPVGIHVAGNIAFASYVVSYVLGLKLNLDAREPIGTANAFLLYVLQIVLIPVFTVLEGLGVLYGLLRPETGFHVITKTHHGEGPAPAAPLSPGAAR